jgi:glycosyltransferase involved in cell wall biosynthesis
MASRRPRIVHLITRLELGGAQQNTLYCVEHHDRSRFDVGVWTGQGGFLDPQARSIRDADVRLLPWLVHPVDPLRDAVAVARLAAMLVDVDLVHTHSSKAGIIGRVAARAAGVRGIVHTVHGWSFNDVQSAATRRAYVELERAAARLTDRIVCVSASDRAKGLALGIGSADRYRILRSGIDPSLYMARVGARERTRASLGASAGDVLVGTVANFKPQKGPLDLVEAARRAHAKRQRLKFFVAGDGELREEVIRAVAAAGLGETMSLLGWRHDIPDLLAAADAFVLTSLFEGLPRAVLQAMAAALPVVVTDTGGTSEVVVDGVTGYLVPPGNPQAAAEALVRLADDPQLRRRFGAAGQSRLGAEFDIRRMVVDLEALYDDVLEGRRPGTGDATSASHLGDTRARH